MKKTLTILILLITCIVVLTACDGCSKYNENYKYDGASLIGKWVDKEPDENEYDVYEFIDNEKVILTKYCFGIPLQSLEGTYKVENENQIIINSSFGYEYIDFSIYKENGENRLVLVVLDDLNRPSQGERIMKPYNLSYNKGENQLVGTWKSTANPSEKFVFNDDFTGKSVGVTPQGEAVEYKLYYSTNGNKLYIIIEYMIGYQEQVTASEYTVVGNTLTLSGTNKEDGSKIELTFERE